MMEMMTTISTWMMRMVMMMKMITKNADFYDPPNKLQLQTLKLNSSNENSAPCQRQAWNRGQSPLIIQPRHGKTPCGAITNFPAGRPPRGLAEFDAVTLRTPAFCSVFYFGQRPAGRGFALPLCKCRPSPDRGRPAGSVKSSLKS